MCGITGIFAYTDFHKTWPNDYTDFMIKALNHRGPDGSGSYVEPGFFLGHTRLAIIDLSASANQPMFSANNRYLISFNGEIYNFRDIQQELIGLGYKFVSHSDTEVLINAWQEWGEACVNKLDGIFAFAIIDRNEKTLFLVRDHLGIKPLFYMENKGQIIFASELQALFGPLNPYPDIDDEDLDTYFTFNYLPAPRTGLKGVRILQAGSILTVNRHGSVSRRYWKPEYQVDLAPWGKKTVDRFEEILTSSVKKQMVSDAPLGLFLSGGLDSYTVALSAVSSGQSSTAFTLGFEEANFNEVPAALIYAKHLNITNEISMFAWSETDIHKTLGVMNELLADASCFPLYQLSDFASKKVKVVLAGDGGDELLAGYDTYKADQVMPYIRMMPAFIKRAAKVAASYLPSDNRRYGWRMVMDRLLAAADEGVGRDHASLRRIFDNGVKKRLYRDEFINSIKKNDPVAEYAGLMKEVPAGRSYLTATQHADIMFHLPSILAKVDRMSMANGLEVRVPFLSKPMVEFCINLPDTAKRHKGKGKRILREAISGKVPPEGLKRPKSGFLPPVDRWFRYPGPMINVFGDYLNTARHSLDRLNWSEVDVLWSDHRSGKVEAGFILLGILQFINWSLKCRE